MPWRFLVCGLLSRQEEFAGLYNEAIRRANKQDTVTTSSTEAELLAISQTAKEAIYIRRLLAALKLRLPHHQELLIECDNRQTLRLLLEESARLQTKPGHVDIHNHWLRQEVQCGNIKPQWVQSQSMITDGLKKALISEKFAAFRDNIGLATHSLSSAPWWKSASDYDDSRESSTTASDQLNHYQLPHIARRNEQSRMGIASKSAETIETRPRTTVGRFTMAAALFLYQSSSKIRDWRFLARLRTIGRDIAMEQQLRKEIEDIAGDKMIDKSEVRRLMGMTSLRGCVVQCTNRLELEAELSSFPYKLVREPTLASSWH